jgi:CTP synthase
VTFINLTYVVRIDAVGEQKTKPAQNGIRALMQLGIRPDFVICRCEEPLLEKTREKIALHAGLHKERIIDDSTQSTVYNLPEYFMKQKFDQMLLEKLGLERKLDGAKLEEWSGLVSSISKPEREVNVAIVGKYTDLRDAYTSVREALVHAGVANGIRVGIKWIESTDLENGGDAKMVLDGVDGILVPGGFGKRGAEGMINAIRYARENKIPYLGLCFGMQLMAVEYARNVCGIQGANSAEFDSDTKDKVIDIMEEQKSIMRLGGTMRLGKWSTKISENTRARSAYGSGIVDERHRHRYELNNAYRELLEKKGMRISATTMDGSLAEIIEWQDSFGIGTQAHPELKSRLEKPSPLFVDFIREASR